MKKNKMMRLASVMMVMTLMTTSVISGTFAKYVTSDSAKDTARVAKFGVVVTAGGFLFDETYKVVTENNGPGQLATGADATSMTVVSVGHVLEAVDNVVAPGTKNTDGLTFTITGQPEVDVQLDVNVKDENLKKIFLAEKDDLPDMTTGDKTDTFDNAKIYEPIKFTLEQKKGTGEFAVVKDADENEIKNVSIDELKEALEGLSKKYEANANLADEVGTLKITWSWDFDDNSAGTYDQQDTLLGDLAATTTLAPEITLTAGTDYNLDTCLEVTVTVTQID